MNTYTIGYSSPDVTVLFHISGTPYGIKLFKPMSVRRIATYTEEDVVFKPRQYMMKDLQKMHPSLLLNQLCNDNMVDHLHIIEFADVLTTHYAFLIPLPNDRNIDLILVADADVQVDAHQSQTRKDKNLVRKIQNQKTWNVAGIKGKR